MLASRCVARVDALLPEITGRAGPPCTTGKKEQLEWRISRHTGTPSETTTKDTMSLDTQLHLFTLSTCCFSINLGWTWLLSVGKSMWERPQLRCIYCCADYGSSRRTWHGKKKEKKRDAPRKEQKNERRARNVSGRKTNHRRPNDNQKTGGIAPSPIRLDLCTTRKKEEKRMKMAQQQQKVIIRCDRLLYIYIWI